MYALYSNMEDERTGFNTRFKTSLTETIESEKEN